MLCHISHAPGHQVQMDVSSEEMPATGMLGGASWGVKVL